MKIIILILTTISMAQDCLDDDSLLTRTDQEWVDGIYDVLEVTDKVFRKNGIKYSLIGGSLLGAIRHKGLIPWDDDADIAVADEDYSKIQNLHDELLKEGYGVRWWPGGLQIYPLDNSILDQIPFGTYIKMAVFGKNEAPFLDIFPMKLEGDKLVYSTMFARNNWPKEYIEKKYWDKISDLPFGHLTLMGPENEESEKFLDRSYGPSWRWKAYQMFDHKNLRSREPVPVRVVDFGHPKRSGVEASKL